MTITRDACFSALRKSTHRIREGERRGGMYTAQGVASAECEDLNKRRLNESCVSGRHSLAHVRLQCTTLTRTRCFLLLKYGTSIVRYTFLFKVSKNLSCIFNIEDQVINTLLNINLFFRFN